LKKGLDILFDYLLDRKQGFPDYKNQIRAKSKIGHFSKEVNPCFWSKIGNFLSIRFSEKWAQVTYMIMFDIVNKAL